MSTTFRNSEPTNAIVADALEQVGALLEAQHAEGFRVRAYQRAAESVRTLERDVADVARKGGRKELVAIPAIGQSIAAAIEEIVHTGRLALLDRLVGELCPEDLFMLVPGIGRELASRIHHDLDIDTLEDLEVAAHDGRLESLPGFGRRRVLAVRQALESILSRSTRRRARRLPKPAAIDAHHDHEPSIELILEVDSQYRSRADAGGLPTIAPRRFNPHGDSWLPILHLEREGWSFTALYSNTARAHKLNKTRDWVVIFFERDGDEGQRTVVTEYTGPLVGQRVVRGREAECAEAVARTPRSA